MSKKEKETTLQAESWGNVPVSSLRINFRAIWKTYLGPTCFSWEKRAKEKNCLTLISWISLSLFPVLSYNITPALSPQSKADTLPFCHFQPVPLAVTAAANQPLSTLKPEGCQRKVRARDGERQWWRGEKKGRTEEAAKEKIESVEARHSRLPSW